MTSPLPYQTLSSFVSRLSISRGRKEQPSKQALLLPCFFSGNASTCTFPSLSLRESAMDTMVSPSTTSDSFEDIASSRLSNPLCLSKQSVASVPGTLLRNVSLSFKTMLNSQLSNHRVTSMFDKTRFPEAINEFKSAAIDFRPVSLGNDVAIIDEKSRFIIPVVFDCSFGIKILGSFDVVHSIQTPGVFISTFSSPNNRLETINLELDTKSLVISMKKKCEEIVQMTLVIGFALNADVPCTPPCVKVRGSQLKTVHQSWIVEDERSDKTSCPRHHRGKHHTDKVYTSSE